jgi:hypothetical protein
MRKKRIAYRTLVGKPEGKGRQEDKDVGGWIILKWILDMRWYGLDCSGSEFHDV